MTKGDDFGSVSGWNEGNFKNLRLHEAQEMINIGKVNPFSLSEDGTSWKYEGWKAGIDILFGEGISKYAKDEIDEVKAIKNFVEKYILIHPPFKYITIYNIQGKQTKFKSLKENQNNVKKYLEEYEEKTKKFNDIHGLSTRNLDGYDEDEI